MKRITEARLEKEFRRMEEALSKVKILDNSLKEKAKECLEMAKRYHEDAKHFRKKGDYASAFGALNYAFGWLDAGAVLGVFEVDRKSGLFVVD